MASRVVHLRLDDSTLIGCIDYFESHCTVEPRLVPESTKVSWTIAAVIAALRSNNVLPSYTKEELKDEFSERFQKPAHSRPLNVSRLIELNLPSEATDAPEPSSPASEPWPEEQPTQPTQPTQPATPVPAERASDMRQRLRALIDEGVQAVTTPKPELDPAVWMPDPKDMPDPGEFWLDMAKQPRLTVLPSGDEFVELALIMDDPFESRVEQMCISIAYYALPARSWSSEAARQLIDKLRPHVLHYYETLEPSEND